LLAHRRPVSHGRKAAEWTSKYPLSATLQETKDCRRRKKKIVVEGSFRNRWRTRRRLKRWRIGKEGGAELCQETGNSGLGSCQRESQKRKSKISLTQSSRLSSAEKGKRVGRRTTIISVLTRRHEKAAGRDPISKEKADPDRRSGSHWF